MNIQIPMSEPSRLYADIVNEAGSSSKRALLTARLIEENLIAEGWPVGKRYGSELEIAQRYHVGRLVAREALRVMQRRGTARMQRGRGGGMVVVAPTIEEVVSATCDFLVMAGATITDQMEALGVVDRIASRAKVSGSAALSLFRQCIRELRVRLDDLPCKSADRAIERPALVTQAAQLARKLAPEITRSACDIGRRIGSESDLCDRYAVSRAVMRQAIRILEDCGSVEARRGRGYGLVARKPQAGPTIRLVCVYVAGSETVMWQDWETYKLLHAELARLAAKKITQDDKTRLERLIFGAQTLSDTAEGTPLENLDRELAKIARNPVLELLFRAIKAHGYRVAMDGLAYTAGSVAGYQKKAIEVLQAIRAGDSQRAAEAEQGRHEFLVEHVRLARMPRNEADRAA